VALEHGFATVGLPEILAITTKTNLRSQAVMGRIGMTYDRRGTSTTRTSRKARRAERCSTGSYRTP
jgi:RimJ/RimL family protein N-acetyltransferase